MNKNNLYIVCSIDVYILHIVRSLYYTIIYTVYSIYMYTVCLIRKVYTAYIAHAAERAIPVPRST